MLGVSVAVYAPPRRQAQYAILINVQPQRGLALSYQLEHVYNKSTRKLTYTWKEPELIAARKRPAYKGELSVGFLPDFDQAIEFAEDRLLGLEFDARDDWSGLTWVAEGLETLERAGYAVVSHRSEKLERLMGDVRERNEK